MTDEEASRRADAAAETTSKAAEFGRRLLGAALLDADTYEDVEADRSANVQAFLVVLLSAIAAGIASIDNNGVSGIFVIAPAALLGWWLWAYLTYMIGTRLLPRPETEADHGELLRTIGFSSSPGILMVFGAYPPAAPILFLICGTWMLVAMVVGVRQALDYAGRGATGRAIAVCALGFPIYVIFLTVALLVVGPWPV
jgi:hypothetical protein